MYKLFPNSFQNLPNLHVNRHLVSHARQYAMCVNTAVGIKEMVHQIFKSIVPHTNKHNLELTLLKQINTLQTLRYLVNGGIDKRMPHYSTQSAFIPLITTPRLSNLLSGWCVNNYGLSIHSLDNTSNQLDIEGKNKYLLFDFISFYFLLILTIFFR